MKMTSETAPVISPGLVIENRPLAADTFLMTVEAPEVSAGAGPGQFAKVRSWPETEGPLLDRPFSIHRAEGAGLSFLYRVVGPATGRISRARRGDRIKITGPLGRGLNQALGRPGKMYLAAGGIGLAPMALALDWLGGPGSAHLFYGERSGSMQVDEAWLKTWAGDFTATAEDGSGYGRCGLVTGPLAEALAREPRPIFACGPIPMLAAVSGLAARFGVTPWVSVEAGMACGFGVCLTCSLPLAGGGRFKACQDGPVVDGSTVAWEEVRS